MTCTSFKTFSIWVCFIEQCSSTCFNANRLGFGGIKYPPQCKFLKLPAPDGTVRVIELSLTATDFQNTIEDMKEFLYIFV
jgi:hypothetical protein